MTTTMHQTLCCTRHAFATPGAVNKSYAPLRSRYCARLRTSASFSGVPLSATPAAEQQLPLQFNMPDINTLDLNKATEGLAVLQQYSVKAADLAGAAWSSAVSPFQVFGGAWFLNLMFFAVLGLMAYSLLVLAPRQ